MNCPVCKKSNSAFRFEINSYRIMDCLACTHRFAELELNPEKVTKIYSDQYFLGGKDGYPDYTLEKDMLIARGEKYADITERFMKPGILFDVGAAAGFLMKGFKNKDWEVHGIEPNSNMTGYGRKKLGLDIRTGTLESINNEPEVKADLVLMIQVVAHLFDLDRSMNAVDRILKRDGYLLVETWDKNSIMACLLGQNWHEYSPPSTLNFFSKKTLDLLMKNHGFLKIASGRPGKKIHSRHARSLLKHKLENSRRLKWISGIEKLLPLNKYLPYPSEDLFWALYQKNEK